MNVPDRAVVLRAMRAICVERYGGPEVLILTEVERPLPISTEVLIEVHAAPLNPVDYKARAVAPGLHRWGHRRS